jgi:proline iminopeptidase
VGHTMGARGVVDALVAATDKYALR